MRKDIKHFTGSLNTIAKPDLLKDEDLAFCENFERKGTGNLSKRMTADEYAILNTYLSNQSMTPIDFIKWYAPRKPKDCISDVVYVFFVKKAGNYEIYLIFEKAAGFDSEKISIDDVTYSADCEFNFTSRGDSLVIADFENRCQLITIDVEEDIISRVMGVSAPTSKPYLEEIKTLWDNSFFEEESSEGSLGECSYYRLSYTVVTKFGEESNGSPKSNNLDLAFNKKDTDGKITRWVKRILADNLSLPDNMDKATKEIAKYFGIYIEKVNSVEGKDVPEMVFACQKEIYNKDGNNSYTITLSEDGKPISYENDIAPIAREVTSAGEIVFFGNVKTKVTLPFDFEYIFEMKLNNLNAQSYIDGIVRIRLFESKVKDKDDNVVFDADDYIDGGGNLENRHHIRIFDFETITMIPVNVIGASAAEGWMDLEINFPTVKAGNVHFFYLCFNTYNVSWGGVGIPAGKYRSYEYGRFFDCMSGSSDTWTEEKAYHPDRIRSLKSLVCAPCDIIVKADEAINKCDASANGEFQDAGMKYINDNIAYLYGHSGHPIGRKCVQINNTLADGLRFGDKIHANNEHSVTFVFWCSFLKANIVYTPTVGLNTIIGNSADVSDNLAGWVLNINTDGTYLQIRLNVGDTDDAYRIGMTVTFRKMDYAAFPNTFDGYIGLSINFEEEKAYLLMVEGTGFVIAQGEVAFGLDSAFGGYKKSVDQQLEFGVRHYLDGAPPIDLKPIDEMKGCQFQYMINTYINDIGCMMNIMRFHPTFRTEAMGYNYTEDKAGKRLILEDTGDLLATTDNKIEPQAYYYDGTYKRTYFVWHQKLGTVGKFEAMVQYYDHETGGYSEAVGTGKLPYADVQDNHGHAAIIVADNGKIIIVHEKLYGTAANGEHNSQFLVKISDESETLGWTEPGGGWLEVGSQECYPKLFKLSNGNLFIVARNSLGAGQRYNVKIWKSTDNGESWDSGYVVASVDNGVDEDWAYNVRFIQSDSQGIHIGIHKLAKSGGDGYQSSYYLRTEDGITWENVTGGFTKNIVTVGAITRTELDTAGNYFRVGHSSDSSDHRMFTCGVIGSNDKPYLIQMDGNRTSGNTTGWYLRYWNSGTTSWSKISISCGLTLPGPVNTEGVWLIKFYTENKFDIYTTMGYNEDRTIQKWQTINKGTSWTLKRQWPSNTTIHKWIQLIMNEPDSDYFFLFGARYLTADESDLYSITTSDLIHNNNLSYGIAKKVEFKHFPYRQKWTDVRGINCPDLYFRDYPFELSNMFESPSFLKFEELNTLVICSYSKILRFVLKGDPNEWATSSQCLIPKKERLGVYIRNSMEIKNDCLKWMSLDGLMRWDAESFTNISKEIIDIPLKDSMIGIELPKQSQYWLHDNEAYKLTTTLTFSAADKKITKTGQGVGADYWEGQGVRVKDRIFIIDSANNEDVKHVTEVNDTYFVVNEDLTNETVACTLFKTKSYVFQENFKEFTTFSGLDIIKSAILYGGKNVDDVNLFLNSYGKIEKYPGTSFASVYSEINSKKFQIFKQRLRKLMLHYSGSSVKIVARVFNIRFGSPYYKDYEIPNTDIISILSGEWKGIDGGYKGNYIQFMILDADGIEDMSFKLTEPKGVE